jgi:hypothetical protein
MAIRKHVGLTSMAVMMMRFAAPGLQARLENESERG